MDGMIRSGELENWSEAARIIGVKRARMTQVASLMLLAPHIVDAILGFTPLLNGKHYVNERRLRTIAAQIDWLEQYRL